MIDTATRRARLVTRQHLARTATSIVAATRDLVALHSSDPLTPHLGLWARVPGYTVASLNAELVDTRALWRLHAMRRTLWIAAADEVAMFDAAAGYDVARKERKRLIGWVEAGRPDAERWLAELARDVIAAVGERPGITTRELNAALPTLATKITVGSGKWTSEAAIGSRLLYVLAMELQLRRAAPAGSWKSSQYGWALAGAVKRMDAALGRAQLVGRYVARFGPVTETDVGWWTGLTKTRTRKALQQAGAMSVELEEGTGFVLPDAAESTTAAGSGADVPGADRTTASSVALLPGLDPTPMGYKERGWFLGEHQAALFDRNGNIGPTIWIDGRIVGGWAVREDATVVVRLLEDVGAEAESHVEAEAEALTTWLSGTPITPRFRTPLEKELVG